MTTTQHDCEMNEPLVGLMSPPAMHTWLSLG
jgi:hypothetical protein